MEDETIVNTAGYTSSLWNLLQNLPKKPPQSPDHLTMDSSASSSHDDLYQPSSHVSRLHTVDHRSGQNFSKSCWKWTTSRTAIMSVITSLVVLSLSIIIWLVLITEFLHRFSHHSKPTSGIARLIYNMSQPLSTLGSLQSLQPFPDDFTRDILPIQCHSHNDYWRHIPLLDAISAGCTSVEADIRVATGGSRAPNSSELYIGHSAGSLRPERTLRSMYIDPLIHILDQINAPDATSPFSNTSEAALKGVFEENPNSTMVLLVDFKQSPDSTNIWDLLQEQLQQLREKHYLSSWNSTLEERVVSPITVVATGDASFEMITSTTTNPHQDIFFDAPLQDLEADAASNSSKYNQSNSHYASVNLSKAIGKTWLLLSDSQLVKIGKQVSTANALGLLSRYWDTPRWPKSVRNRVWGQLIGQGVGVLNADELWTASRKDWRLCSAVGWGICP